LSEKEKEMLETRYNKAKEDGKILLAKYERQKEATAKAAEQAADQNEIVTIRQELIRVKSDNRTLTNQLSYADTRLRELGRHEGFGTSKRSRESIAVPGRVTRQTSSRDSEDSGVFKLPGSQSSQGTPGRTRTSRTVSETRVGRTRPPIGSGSLFHADEEVGEVFSSSYLTDLKDGNCLLDDTGRMSELARRNTMAPAHLKSAYPIESQFFDDNNDGLEESIRNSRLPLRQSARFSTAPGNQTTSFSNASKGPMNLSALPADTSREIAGVNSPAVNRLSQATSSLSLDSPATATRSKRTLSNLSSADLPAKKKVPPPTAFTIDAPKPGNAVRKTKATKQPCTEDHGAKKQICETTHLIPEDAQDTPPLRRSSRRSGESASQGDSQQDATFVRDTTRASKRSNVSYMKPGPPTPGRNKSMESNTSVDSTSIDAGSVSTLSVTPRSKRSTASLAKSLKTPLSDSTNQSNPSTPGGAANKNSSKFKVKGMTPLNLKKAIGQAFRPKGLKNKSSTYQLMKKQDQTIDRDQSKSKGVKVTTPMKAKERLGKSPRAFHK